MTEVRKKDDLGNITCPICLAVVKRTGTAQKYCSDCATAQHRENAKQRRRELSEEKRAEYRASAIEGEKRRRRLREAENKQRLHQQLLLTRTPEDRRRFGMVIRAIEFAQDRVKEFGAGVTHEQIVARTLDALIEVDELDIRINRESVSVRASIEQESRQGGRRKG